MSFFIRLEGRERVIVNKAVDAVVEELMSLPAPVIGGAAMHHHDHGENLVALLGLGTPSGPIGTVAERLREEFSRKMIEYDGKLPMISPNYDFSKEK